MRPSGRSRFWVGCSLRVGRRMIPAMTGCLLASVGVARGDVVVAPVPAPTGPASSLSAVSCTSARACIAVGSGVAGPLAERWNGERWALQKTPKLALGNEPEVRGLSAVSCSSAGACTAVGTGPSYAPLIERWNGRRWSLQKLSANSFPSELTSVACAAATSCVAAGDAGLERWDGRDWRHQPIQTSNAWVDFSLSSVACASTSACMTVGDSEYGDCNSAGCNQHPLVERWNGVRWTRLAVPKLPNETLYTVTCSASTNCIVDGTFFLKRRSYVFAARWDGSRWITHRVSGPRGRGGSTFLTGVSCASAGDCVAVGSTADAADIQKPFATHWDGHRWRLARIVVPPDATQPSVTGVSCEPNQTCTAVGGFTSATGQQATLVERWRRSRWSIQRSANYITSVSVALNDVSCASRTSCTAVGGTVNVDPGTAIVEHWDGLRWAIQKPPPPVGASFNADSCPTGSGCAAVGSYQVNSGQFQALAAASSNGHWSIARVIPPGAFDSSLTGVSCASPTPCIAVGYYQLEANSRGIPFAELWNGTSWLMLAIPMPPDEAVVSGAPIQRVSCASSTACTAVGQYFPSFLAGQSEPLAETWNGSAWTIEEPPTPPGGISAGLAAVSCTPANTCSAVGAFSPSPNSDSRVLLERRTGGSWSAQTASSPTDSNLLDAVSCPSETACVAVGSAGGKPVAEAWNGSAWSTQQTPAIARGHNLGGSLAGVSCASPTTCIAVGSIVTQVPNENQIWHPFFERLS